MDTEKSGTISGGPIAFRYRENGSGESVLWLAEAATSPALHALVAAQHRVIALEPIPPQTIASPQLAPAIAQAATFLGLERFTLVAEGVCAAAAIALALSQPTTITALLLLAPAMIDASGRATAAADEPLIARLGALTMPLLALFGTRDALVPPEAARHYRERIARCSTAFVYDAGHDLGADRPQAVAELVTDFIARGERFLVRQTDDRLYP